MRTKIMITTLLAASLMLSCNPKEILEPVIDYPAFVVIDGDTVKTRDDKGIGDKFKGHPEHYKNVTTGDTIVLYKSVQKIKPSKLANLTNLMNIDRKGQKFRLVTFGGSLTAGVRDGGLFNEGMETAFGSLLANQMGIDFKNPLFDFNDYNGFGRKVTTIFNPTNGPVPKFKNVTNNTGIDPKLKESNGNVILKKVSGNFDNYSFPFSSFISKGETKAYISGVSSSMNPFEKRLGNPNLSSEFSLGKTFDFFVVEIPYFDDFFLSDVERDYERFNLTAEFDNANPPNFGPGAAPNPTVYYFNFFKKIQRIKAKGIILNTPNVFDFPYYKQNYKKEIQDLVSKYQINELNWTGGGGNGILQVPTAPFNNPLLRDVILGYSGLDSLLSPVVNINIKPGVKENIPVTLITLNNEEIEATRQLIKSRNAKLELFSKKLQIPVVDIYSIFESISNGNLKSIDGVDIQSTNKSNVFFSSDGQTLSAFGQAVIANEIIKVINAHYKTDIPLIPTREYLK